MESMEGLTTLRQFTDKKIFITGHTGFKGTWLFYWLHSLGAHVKGYALAPETKPSLFAEVFGSRAKDSSIIADINDYARLSFEIESFQPDFIFHLAAQPLVRRSYKIPLETLATNAIGTAHVLEAVKLVRKPCVCICITTDKVYENKEWAYPYRENDRLGGHDPYSASKACAELIISSYINSFFNPKKQYEYLKRIASVRAGNVIGGGDWSEDRLIPDLVRAWSNEQMLEIRNPNAIRPWQHVMEPLFGYMQLALHLADGGGNNSHTAWNFGPVNDDHLPVIEIVRAAQNHWKNNSVNVTTQDSPVHEAQLLKLDISKAITELGWKPRMNAAMAIERTIAWYQAFNDGTSAKKLVENDIGYYHTLLTKNQNQCLIIKE